MKRISEYYFYSFEANANYTNSNQRWQKVAAEAHFLHDFEHFPHIFCVLIVQARSFGRAILSLIPTKVNFILHGLLVLYIVLAILYVYQIIFSAKQFSNIFRTYQTKIIVNCWSKILSLRSFFKFRLFSGCFRNCDRKHKKNVKSMIFFPYGPKSTQIISNSLKWIEMVRKGLKWSQMVPDRLKLTQRVLNSPK